MREGPVRSSVFFCNQSLPMINQIHQCQLLCTILLSEIRPRSQVKDVNNMRDDANDAYDADSARDDAYDATTANCGLGSATSGTDLATDRVGVAFKPVPTPV